MQSFVGWSVRYLPLSPLDPNPGGVSVSHGPSSAGRTGRPRGAKSLKGFVETNGAPSIRMVHVVYRRSSRLGLRGAGGNLSRVNG